MRDVTLLVFTLRAMRDLGDSRARLQPASLGGCWFAGPQPLNGQAVQDLIEDGWLRRSPDGRDLRIDTWPGFAGDDAIPSTDAPKTRPERVFQRQEAGNG